MVRAASSGRRIRESEPGAILERLHQSIARKFVAPQRSVASKCGGWLRQLRHSARRDWNAHRGQDAGKAGNSAIQAAAQQLRTAFPTAKQTIFAGQAWTFLTQVLNRADRDHLTSFRLARMIA